MPGKETESRHFGGNIIPSDDPFDDAAMRIQLKASLSSDVSPDSTPRSDEEIMNTSRSSGLFDEDPFDAAWGSMKKDA